MPFDLIYVSEKCQFRFRKFGEKWGERKVIICADIHICHLNRQIEDTTLVS